MSARSQKEVNELLGEIRSAITDALGGVCGYEQFGESGDYMFTFEKTINGRRVRHRQIISYLELAYAVNPVPQCARYFINGIKAWESKNL